MYIVMAPLEKRAEKKTDDGRAATAAAEPPTAGAPAGDTIGDAIAAKGTAPAKGGARPHGAGSSRRPAVSRTGTTVPKMKTHKGTAKRYRKTGSGKWVRPEGLARPSPRDQVEPPHPPLRRQGHRRQVRTRKQLERLMPYAGKGK